MDKLTVKASKVETLVCAMNNLFKSIIPIFGFVLPKITSNCVHNYTQLKNFGIKGIRSACTNQWEKCKIILPFVWPKKSFNLQCRVILCMLLILFGRIVNIMVPVYNQKIVDSLGKKVLRWDLILLYVAYNYFQSIAYNARSFLWTPVEHSTSKEIQTELFQKLHKKSLRWHLAQQTGEVLQIMGRGQNSINSLLSYILFYMGPQVIDIVGSLAFFSVMFNWYFGIVIIATMWLYLRLTTIITEWGNVIEERMKSIDDEKMSRSIESLLNFETVKYYGNEDYECKTYSETLTNYQREEISQEMNYHLLDLVQNAIISFSLLTGCLLCAYLIVDVGTLTASHYVLFSSYVYQLYSPLSWLGSFFKDAKTNYTNIIDVLDLLKEEEEVKDVPDAIELSSVRGEIQFSNVTFGYTPERSILKNISFTVPPGKTVALVGPSGSGKSTTIRLLFRFYDVNDGSISVDGTDIKKLKQHSLREAIGVVPQDTILFNSSIKYNVQYGRLTATEEEVIEATSAADIHDKILNFSEKYETKVGERGMRLSGGEKQRVAIARTILKAPSIVLLDEATSALDTQTEKNIQAALAKVCENKTTIIVAHRLSTINHADEILVLKDGEIVERGQHEKLLEKNGIYAGMWGLQLQNGFKKSVDNNSEDDGHEKQD